MNTAFGLLALAGFLLSLVAHISALCGIDVQSLVPSIWALHVGVFVVFIPMVFQLKERESKNDPMALFRGLPTWAGFTIALLMLYVVLNFFIAFGSSVEGTPTIRGGSFVLAQKGKLVREISESEYHARKAAEVRGFSGHWLIFYFVPLSHFLLRRREQSYA